MDDSLLEFPCSFQVKAMGLAREDFAHHVQGLISGHLSDAKMELSERVSSGGKYVSVTATITAQSREQLDAIYIALNESERVLYTL